MQIQYNGYSVKAVQRDSNYYIKLIELSRLAGVSIQSVSSKVIKNRYKLQGCVIGSSRHWLISLGGCITVLEMFRFPNDGLIAEIKKLASEPQESETRPVDAESFADSELERIRVQKIKEELKEKDNQAKIDMILQKVKDIDLRLENLSQQRKTENSLGGLIKDCIKEVLREELFGG